MAKENITEEEELVEDFGDGYFAPYQQVFGVSWAFGVSEVFEVSWAFGVSEVLGYFVFFCSVSGGIMDICAAGILDILGTWDIYLVFEAFWDISPNDVVKTGAVGLV